MRRSPAVRLAAFMIENGCRQIEVYCFGDHRFVARLIKEKAVPKSKKAWGVATNRCKKKGMKSFKKGSAGDRCRKKTAEKIGEI